MRSGTAARILCRPAAAMAKTPSQLHCLLQEWHVRRISVSRVVAGTPCRIAALIPATSNRIFSSRSACISHASGERSHGGAGVRPASRRGCGRRDTFPLRSSRGPNGSLRLPGRFFSTVRHHPPVTGASRLKSSQPSGGKRVNNGRFWEHARALLLGLRLPLCPQPVPKSPAYRLVQLLVGLL